jgi:hypothetical protein
MRSVMKHSFSDAPTISAPRSRFDRSFAHKTSFDAGWLVPFYWDEVLPGDTFNLETTGFARLSTPFFPIMDNMYMDTHFFFVPYRLIWENFRKFCGEQVDPGDSIDYQIPILSGATASDADPNLATNAGRYAALLNYLGVPDGIAGTDVDISALPRRAYAFIYNEWFRDQNLIDSLDTPIDDGPDAHGTDYSLGKLMRRGKRHDYFTSCLPWPQKGDAVTLPLGTVAKVGADTPLLSEDLGYTNFSNSNDYRMATSGSVLVPAASGPPDATLYADLSNATAATINDLREAFQVQKLLERDARAGTRYSELVRNHFGVEFYDISYRPEYLGGGTTPIIVNPLAQTAQNATTGTTDGTGVGDLGGFGTVGFSGHGFTKSFVEHGLVMGLVSVRADLTYQQGLNRFFSKSTRYDLYWPSLAHLGEQEVLNKEIYCDGSANDDLVFGYQERYAEYRYKPSMITGVFQSAAAASLDAWHLSQEFGSLPTLGQTFIEEDPPLDRVVQVSSEPHFIFDSYTRLLCARPLPVFGVPGMIDHF